MTPSEIASCFDAPVDLAPSVQRHLFFCGDCTAVLQIVEVLISEETTVEETFILNRALNSLR